MEKIGWVVQAFQFTQFQSQQDSFKLSQVCLELIKGAIGGDTQFLETVEKTLDAMEKSTEGVEIFGKKSYSGQNGNFQIVPCNTDKTGQVMAAFMGGYFSCSKTSKNYFFATFSNEEIKFFYSIQTFTLN